ncbi:MAG: hypothetical protein A2Y10_17605 [Planctomycetes bacterium GWF2_41_51]|nr:MAG: hypothetical protein A2Y10_17605 [Planctomycetes bacterium GWF2_41_51]HBG28043.1 hypothetical protein [Phycisphaerales bacterium]
MRNLIKFILLMVVLIVSANSYGTDYYIPHNGIANHAAPGIVGSIAWYFANYGNPGNRFFLTSSADYNINSTLTVPSQTRFDSTVGSTAFVKATSVLDDGVMIIMSDNSSIYNMNIHANRYARHCIVANGKTNVTIDSVVAQKTKNNYTSGDPTPHVIYCKDATKVTIRNCTLRRAGSDPKLNPRDWNGTADLICASNNYDLLILENNLAYALTAGVQMGQTRKAGVNNNIIQHTGLNNLYSTAFHSSDGITAYHNMSHPEGGGPYMISGNEICYYNNNGIHVSGHNITIKENDIYSGAHRAIYLGDIKDNPECSHELLIYNNYLTAGSDPPNNHRIFFRNYDPFTTSVYGNTPNDVNEHSGTCTP